MLTLNKDEQPKEDSWVPVYVGSWVVEGDIFLEIMDEEEKSIIVSMPPELLLGLIQKAGREALADIQVRLENDSEFPVESEPKLPDITKSLKNGDPKLSIV